MVMSPVFASILLYSAGVKLCFRTGDSKSLDVRLLIVMTLTSTFAPKWQPGDYDAKPHPMAPKEVESRDGPMGELPSTIRCYPSPSCHLI